MGFKYLASPYSHPDLTVRGARYTYARTAVANLLAKKIWVYSPIVHCHELALAHDLPMEAEFWWEYNRTMLAASSGLLILKIDGWEESAGVKQEREYAEAIKLDWSYL